MVSIDVGLLIGCGIVFGIIFCIICLCVLIRRELTGDKHK